MMAYDRLLEESASSAARLHVTLAAAKIPPDRWLLSAGSRTPCERPSDRARAMRVTMIPSEDGYAANIAWNGQRRPRSAAERVDGSQPQHRTAGSLRVFPVAPSPVATTEPFCASRAS